MCGFEFVPSESLNTGLKLVKNYEVVKNIKIL